MHLTCFNSCSFFYLSRLNALMFESKDQFNYRVAQTRKALSTMNSQRRKEKERFYDDISCKTEFFCIAMKVLEELFPGQHLETSEYVYHNYNGELFFFYMPGFAPHFAVAVLNSDKRKAGFDYTKLLAKPISFSDLSRMQIENERLNEQIYDSIDLIYHEAVCTKPSPYNSSVFVCSPSPNIVLKERFITGPYLHQTPISCCPDNAGDWGTGADWGPQAEHFSKATNLSKKQKKKKRDERYKEMQKEFDINMALCV